MELAGHILAPPANSGKLDYLLTEREKLQNAMASGQQEFRIVYNGVHRVSGIYPRVTSIAFEDEVWVDKMAFSIGLEWDEDFYNNGIQSYSETWDFTESEEDRRSALVSHGISAVGINTNPSDINNALTNAITFVQGKTGWANAVSGTPGFVGVSGTYSSYENHQRTESVDPQGGIYSVAETFVLSSGTSVHTSDGSFDIDEQGVVTINVNGNIRGLGRGDVAYTRARSKWTSVQPQLPGVASGIYSDLGGTATLFTSNYKTLSVTRNSFAGTIDYSVSYSDSPSENLPSGVLEFTLNYSDSKATRVYASFPIPERALGNVIQDVATSTEGAISINGTAVGKPDFSFNSLKTFVESKVNARRPNSANFETLRMSQHNVTEDEDNNRIQFTFGWTYTVELSNAAVDGDVSI
jgi:hypothetical protein